jgi:hypothetical protein
VEPRRHRSVSWLSACGGWRGVGPRTSHCHRCRSNVRSAIAGSAHSQRLVAGDEPFPVRPCQTVVRVETSSWRAYRCGASKVRRELGQHVLGRDRGASESPGRRMTRLAFSYADGRSSPTRFSSARSSCLSGNAETTVASRLPKANVLGRTVRSSPVFAEAQATLRGNPWVVGRVRPIGY